MANSPETPTPDSKRSAWAVRIALADVLVTTADAPVFVTVVVVWEFDTVTVADTVESALSIEETIAGSLEVIDVISERSDDAPDPVTVLTSLSRELMKEASSEEMLLKSVAPVPAALITALTIELKSTCGSLRAMDVMPRI